MNEHEWENVAADVRRMAVPGGWLYLFHNMTSQETVFVPYSAKQWREGRWYEGHYEITA